MKKTIAILCVLFFILPSVQAISEGTGTKSNQNLPASDAGTSPSSRVSQNNDFWIQVIGRGTIQNGVAVPYLIRYGNNGTQDIPAPLISLSAIPYSPDIYAQIGTSDWQSLQDMIIITAPGSSEHPEKLEPGSSYSIPLKIIGYNNTQFSIIAGPLSSTTFYSPSVIESSLDGSCPSPGILLDFSRSYPSGYASYDGPLGYGWENTFDAHLERMGDGNIAFKKGNRYIDIFGESEDGTFVPYSSDDYLSGSQNGTFELLTKNGNVLSFYPDGWLGYLHDSNGNSINLTYDTQKKLISAGHSSGDLFKFEYGENGKISRFINHAGRTTTYSYDPTGRLLTSVTTPDGRQTRYTYVSRMGGYALSSVKYPDNSGYAIQYDEQGNPVEQTQNNGKNKISYSYDPSAGTTQITDEQGNTGTITLDPDGQMISSENSKMGATRYAYNENGMIAAVTDALGRSSRYDYDGEGNIVAVTDPLDHTTRLAYDNDINALSSISDARGNTLKFTYDDAGNLISIGYPDSTSESFAYDGKGNLVRKTTRSGTVINYQNDNRGQLTRAEYPDGSFTAYTYDGDGNVLTATNRDGTISMVYNPGNQLTEIHYPDGNSFAYFYDSAGRLIQRTDKDGYTSVYTYDEEGNVIQVSDGNKSVIVKYAYDAAGKLIKKELRNGAYTTYAYDSTGQISRLVNYNITGSVLSRFDYQYDASGNPVVADTIEGKYQYSYDTIGQLVKVTYPDGQVTQYSYDAAGNRVSVVNSGGTTSYTTNAMNQYTQAGPVSYSYDANGNLISSMENGKTTTFQYNYDNRLIRVTSPDATLEYTYDALGNRAGVTRNGNPVRYSIDPLGLGEVVAEYDGSGSLIARYTHGMGLVSKIDASGNEFDYHFSPIGHTVDITDSTGNVVNHYQYVPFGEYQEKNEKIDNPFTYVGNYGVMDDKTGLYFMRMRYYSSENGKFVSEDPSGINGGLNLNAYVHNNPISRIDPSGLKGNEINYDYEGFARDFAVGQTAEFTGVLAFGPEGALISPLVSAGIEKYQVYQNAHPNIGFYDNLPNAKNMPSRSSAYDYGINSFVQPVYNPTREANIVRDIQRHDISFITPGYRTPQQAYEKSISFSSNPAFPSANDYTKISQSDLDMTVRNSRMVYVSPMRTELDSWKPYGHYWDDDGGGMAGLVYGKPPGGVDFSNIQLNSLSISDDSDAQTFSYTLKTTVTQPGEAADDIEKASALSFRAFFTGLALPNSVFWVNLNPYEPDRIMDKNLATTDVGRIMLQADLDMKKDYARFENGCVYPIGEEYRKVNLQKETELLNTLKSKYPGESDKIDKIMFFTPLGRWIGPDHIDVQMDKDQIFIHNQSLTIIRTPVENLSTFRISGRIALSESDTLSNLSLSDELSRDLNTTAKEYYQFTADQEDKMITPLVIKEINSAPKYADLRRVYSSLALAQWYKEKYRGTKGIFSTKIDSGDLTGLNSNTSWNFEDTYQEFLKSIYKGEFRCNVTTSENVVESTTVKNGYITHTTSTRSEGYGYGVGGVVFSKILLTKVSEITPATETIMQAAIFQESPSWSSSNPSCSTSGSDKIATTGTTKDSVIYIGDSIFFTNTSVKKSIIPLIHKSPTKKAMKSATPTSWATPILIVSGAVIVGITLFMKRKTNEDYEDDEY